MRYRKQNNIGISGYTELDIRDIALVTFQRDKTTYPSRYDITL